MSENPPMNLHVLSDLHLSLAGMDVAETDADLVILAGDIARPDKALAWARQIRKPVIYVAGNHEFYNGDLQGTLHELRRHCARRRHPCAGVRRLGLRGRAVSRRHPVE